MQPTEIWVPVYGWEGLYEVSNYGKVRSLGRTVQTNRGPRHFKPKILRTYKTFGYVCVDLCRDKFRKHYRMHRVVLMSFTQSEPAGMDVCHADGTRDNNAIWNLHWGTRSQNFYEAVAHGTHSMARKTHCPRGHKLIEPNLMPGTLRAGRRDCWSCRMVMTASNRRRKLGRTPFTPDEIKRRADLKYEAKMRGVAA